MTRYSRARGSKASNERVPNDATPWHIMKQQLEMKQKEAETIAENKSAKELVKAREHSLNHKVASVNSNWAEFEESRPKATQQDRNKHPISVIPKQTASSNINTNEIGKQLKNDVCETTNNALSKPLKRKFSKDDSNHITNGKKENNKQRCYNADEKIDTKNDENILRKTNKKRGKDTITCNNNDSINTNTNAQTDNLGSEDGKNSQIKNEKKLEPKQSNAKSKNSKFEGILSKRQKRNIKKKEKFGGNSRTFNATGNDWGNSADFDKTNNAENRNQQNNGAEGFVRRQYQSNNFINRTNNFGNRNLNQKREWNHLKPPKVRDDKEHKRRKPDLFTKILINGEEVEVTKYDGFPIKKEDAIILQELKEKMIMNGIPKSEIDITMKLERRRAEKALYRARKSVCFNCRKSGHNLSECPELTNTGNPTGICFKCGSTEHTHFECKVTRTDDFRYATCFICREQGHISRQCPDNPNGVYPQGGACRLCGDVTHLRRNCPDLIQQNEESAITLGTINGAALESLDGEAATNKPSCNVGQISKK